MSRLPALPPRRTLPLLMMVLLTASLTILAATRPAAATPGGLPSLESPAEPAPAASASPAPAPAVTPPPLNEAEAAEESEIRGRLASWREALNSREAQLMKPDNSISGLGLIRRILTSVRGNLTDELPLLLQRRARIANQLQDLGPAPTDGSVEAADLAATRAGLSYRVQLATAAVTEAQALVAFTDRLIDQVNTARRAIFLQTLMTRGPSPIWFETIGLAWSNAAEIAAEMQRDFLGWYRLTAGSRNEVLPTAAGLGFSLLLALALLGPVTRRSRRRMLNRFEALPATTVTRHARVLLRAALQGGLALLACLPVLLALAAADLLEEDAVMGFVLAGIAALVAQRAAMGMVCGMLCPDAEGRWRMLPVAPVIGRRLVLLLAVSTTLLALDHVLGQGLTPWDPELEFTVMRQALLVAPALVLLPVTARLIVQPLPEPLSDGTEPQAAAAVTAPAPQASGSAEAEGLRQDLLALPARRILSVLLWTLGLLLLLLLVVGFTTLAREALLRLHGLAALAAAYVLVRGMLLGLLAWSTLGSAAAGQAGAGGEVVAAAAATGATPETGRSGARLIRFWLGIGIDLILLMFAVPLALMLLRVEWAEIRTWILRAFFGLRIGGITISIGDLLTAVAVLIAVLTATRLVQGFLERRVFPDMAMDQGVRDSFRTITGYAGLLIALAMSVSALGFDLSNLAIIAGALSVGIGFGLQSIVNNFVSGLILLFERPIKVGDWIVTDQGQGIVRRISVRATEIETFQKSSLIIPNAVLLSSSLTNWTLRNRIGRVSIEVGVSYESDLTEASRILLEIARSQPDALGFPGPFLHINKFAESAVMITLHAFVRDVDRMLALENAMRIEILQRFRTAGIEIPLPQSVLTVRHDGGGLTLAGDAA